MAGGVLKQYGRPTVIQDAAGASKSLPESKVAPAPLTPAANTRKLQLGFGPRRKDLVQEQERDP